MLDPPEPDPNHPSEIPLDRLDADAVKVIARLRHMHHQAYLVGGCVRDVLLGAIPKDFDVATSAHPGEVRAVFRNCRLIGRRFRLAHVFFRGGKVIEVATFRKNPIDLADDVPDGDLLITRDNVFGTAEEDALRRDFTVNGLFYDTFAGEVIDYVGGRADLEARRIATIGDPEIRMREDPVRALRAIRFAARLGFTIAPDTFAAMRRHAGEIARCAPPRILEEVLKVLRCGASSRAFELMRTSGALPIILPALAAYVEGADEAQRRRFFSHLSALDAVVRSRRDVSEAALLGALLIHLPEPEGKTSPRDELLSALVGTARLPRRIAERVRLALDAQAIFRSGPRRRQRGLPAQSYYQDALQLLEVTARATGEGEDLLARWQSGEALVEPGKAHGQPARRNGHAPRAPHANGHGGHGHAAAHHDSAAPEVGAEEPRASLDEPRASDESRTSHAAAAAGTGEEAGGEGVGEGRRRRRRRGGRRRRRRGGASAAAAGVQNTP
ncbi:MAG TPA: polynucleotide adenylyltransferase PcnB [Anaeromyxobacteraceae bacterium]|nr:polynucleotide adenylyltransferase PcnB [Anaeromyxobacteraceae bacterium]